MEFFYIIGGIICVGMLIQAMAQNKLGLVVLGMIGMVLIFIAIAA